MNKYKFACIIFLLFSSMILISLLSFKKVFAQTVMYVYPSSQEAMVGTYFNISIKISDVIDLYGWEFKLSWDPLIVSVSELIEGDFLKSRGQTYLVKIINNTVGYIHSACTLVGTPSGVSGSGTLAVICFYVNQSGETTLDLYGTKLVNSLEEAIAHETVDGYFSAPVIHDIAIVNVTVSQRRVISGQIVEINATLYNNGTTMETFNITALYDSFEINRKTVTNLGVGETLNVIFIWNTTGVPYGNYTLKVEASILPGETNVADNIYVFGNVTIMAYPEANFWYTPILPHIGETVTFNASLSTPNGGVIILYEWDFGTGDLLSTHEPIAVYTYTSQGVYNVTLTVTDSENLSDTTWQLVYVELQPKRDIAIINVTLSDREAYVGNIIEIYVVVKNFGDISESFNVSVYYNEHFMDAERLTNLYPLEEAIVVLQWDSTNALPYQNYTIKAEISKLENEINLTNNLFIDGSVMLKMPGDINCDLKVDYKDLFRLASSYGTNIGEERYDRLADFNQDGKVDYKDLFQLAANYGKKW